MTDYSGIGSSLGKGMGIAIADFNNDGLMDIFIANDTERNFLFINQGNGTFKEAGVCSIGVAYDDQGQHRLRHGQRRQGLRQRRLGGHRLQRPDGPGIWACSATSGGRSLNDVAWKTNIGALSRPFSGWSIGFIDYDNDGWKDLYSANGDVDNIDANSKQHDTMFQNVDGKHVSWM